MSDRIAMLKEYRPSLYKVKVLKFRRMMEHALLELQSKNPSCVGKQLMCSYSVGHHSFDFEFVSPTENGRPKCNVVLVSKNIMTTMIGDDIYALFDEKDRALTFADGDNWVKIASTFCKKFAPIAVEYKVNWNRER